MPAAWREVDLASNYTLWISPDELRVLGERLDGLIRPLIAANRQSAPADAALVEVDLFAFPRTQDPWRRGA